MQPVFSFKLRGAYNKMSGLTREELKRGVICSSAGNHAQGVALAAQKLGCRAVIVMPVTTPAIKVDAVRARGADVLLHGDSYTEAYAEAKRLEDVPEPGEVPKAGTAAERRAIVAKSLLAQEIQSAAVAQPFSRQPDARYGDGPMRREALDRLFSAEGDAGKAALLALLDAVERIAAEQCPQAGKNAYEIATGGWLPADDAQSMGMLAAAFGPCAIVDRRQLVFLWRLQAAVFDTSISVRMLQEHLAQELYERKRKDLYTQNPELDLSVQLRVPNADGVIGIQDPDHKVKAVANAMGSSKDEVSGGLLAKPDVVHAARGEGVLQKYLNGQLDKQKVALARFLFYCADLQANLTAAGHHDTAALMGVIAKFIQAWDMSGLTEGVRSRANEDLRVLLVALLGAEVHAVHINHASLKRRKASLPMSLIVDLIENIDGMQGMQATSSRARLPTPPGGGGGSA
jgi:hypothetical protein